MFPTLRYGALDARNPPSIRRLPLPRVKTLLLVGSLALAACSRREAPVLRTEAVSRGPIAEVVSATGGVEAIVTVNVGSQVSGVISELKVDFNSVVKKNQLLARLDPRLFEAAQFKAVAGVASAEADALKAKAALADAKRIEKRTADLLERKLVSQADVDTAVANREQADAALASADARVKQARADTVQAALNLEFTRIVSPIDGIVISRTVDVGQTVAAAFQAPQLFVIANDLTKMRVLANIDEADVGKVKEGQEVKFTVDSYPGEEFNGTISQVRQAPSTVNNVVTYAAEIDAPNPERKLRQGMTAAVQVITAKRAQALRVANAALRWKPDDAPPPRDGEAKGPRADKGSGSAAGSAQGDRPPRNKGEGKAGEAVAHNEVLDRPVGVQGAQNPADRRGGEKRKQRKSKVYKLVEGKPVMASVVLGVSDGHSTEVISGLDEGDNVIIGGAAVMGPGGQQRGGPRRGLF
jgi:HlyD family secretion protein